MRELDHDAVRHVGAGRLDDLERERARVAVLDREDEVPESRRLAASTWSTMRARRSDSPAMTARSRRAVLVVEVDVLAAQRHGGAVNGRERRAQLVRDRRDELALQLLDAALLGQVAQRVDGAVGELDGGDGDPELSVAELERERLGVLGRVDGARWLRVPAARSPPSPGRTSCGRRPSDLPASERPVIAATAGFQRRTTPDAVDEEDAVADVREHARCALALLAHLLLQPGALEDVAGLVGDQLGERDGDASNRRGAVTA